MLPDARAEPGRAPAPVVQDAEAERDHEIVVSTDAEGSADQVRVLGDAHLEVEDLLGAGASLLRLRELDPRLLEQGFEVRDEVGLAEPDFVGANTPFLCARCR